MAGIQGWDALAGCSAAGCSICWQPLVAGRPSELSVFRCDVADHSFACQPRCSVASLSPHRLPPCTGHVFGLVRALGFRLYQLLSCAQVRAVVPVPALPPASCNGVHFCVCPCPVPLVLSFVSCFVLYHVLPPAVSTALESVAHKPCSAQTAHSKRMRAFVAAVPSSLVRHRA
jgi:hypothetical protein